MKLYTGVTVEQAIAKGLAELGIERSQAKITIVAKEKKGFLGFGKKDAQVELTVLPSVNNLEQTLAEDVSSKPVEQLVTAVVAEEQEATKQTAQPSQDQETSPVDSVTKEEFVKGDAAFEAFAAREFGEEVEQESQVDLEQVRAEVMAYVESILYEMDIEATMTISGGRRQMVLQIDTPEPGRVIGYHGKVLKALQLLAQNFLHDRYSKYFNISINVHDYLEHRTETLVDMAHKAAKRVRETGREYRLNPMTNHERKIIHKTITRLPGVVSYSEGDDPNRYVVVTSRD